MPVYETIAHYPFKDTNEHHRLCYGQVLSLNLHTKKVVLFRSCFTEFIKGTPMEEQLSNPSH